MEQLTPVFLLSLPRSGSTLLQRLMAAQPGVATASEPWVLLPFLSTLRDEGTFTDYDHRLFRQGLEDFGRELPEGLSTYRRALRELALRLYSAAVPEGTRYFVDKTPRYHLVVPELFGVFPEARFVFLWRNPLALVASAVETWAESRWSVHRWHVDLFQGLSNLVAGYREHEQDSVATRYEDLVVDPSGTMARIARYLDLPFDPVEGPDLGAASLRGRLGDQTGSRTYRTVSDEPLDKWKEILAGAVRKRWCRRYLEWIGRDRLRVMGYDLDELRSDLDALPSSPRRVVSDAVRLGYGRLSGGRRGARAWRR